MTYLELNHNRIRGARYRDLQKTVLVCVLALATSACGLIQSKPVDLPPRSSVQPGETITVQGNQNVYGIAKQYDVSMRDLIVLNNIHAPFTVRSGQKLLLPAQKLGGHDTYGIAASGTPAYSQTDAGSSYDSQGPSGSGGSTGEGYGSGGVTSGSSGAYGAPTPVSASQGAVQQEELAPLQSAPVSEAPVAPLPPSGSLGNGSYGAAPLSGNGNLNSGQNNSLSGGSNTGLSSGETPSGGTQSSLTPSNLGTLSGAAATNSAKAGRHAVTSSETSAVNDLNAPTPAAKTVTTTVDHTGATEMAAATSAVSKGSSDPSSPNVSFAWPVQGPVLSGYGPKGQGLSNDGVNIGAPKGAPVVAAASGIVVYAGSEMKGFGNLVLIRHQGGWVTAYAHLDRALVAKDAVVAQGDMIGTVGKTGNVPSPQLHFETRYNGKPVDPAGVIKAQ